MAETNKPENPPAFPYIKRTIAHIGNSEIVEQLNDEGMTLRDYFAAKAMVLYEPREVYVHKAAKRAYELADAMLEARSK